MGVKNLWDILDSCKKTLPLHHLRNKRVCIDLSCWIVQLQKVNKSHCSLKEKLYLRGLFHRLRALIALNCSLIFVTDGSIPALKIATYKRRLNLENEIVREDTDTQKASSLRRNMGSEFSCMIKEAKVLGMALGIPCLDGIEEAEAQCALLNSESVCDGCFTSDSDVFLFGARTVYRDICLGDGGYIVCYEMEDIEKKLGLGRNSLIALALLLGCDYSQGVHGFGPESACQVIKSLSDDIILQRLMSEGVSFLKKLKNLKKARQGGRDGNTENSLDHGNKQTGERNDEFSQVINAYLKPKCHSVDSDPVYRVLALHPFQRSALQHVCSQYFGWPPEKTDEYILPKIAERELRRFANLRSTSSEFGAQLPLHEMPIKCPISEVIKHRKVAGKECFEVSWLRFDGLQTSIVPADLVQSACPEKILEFEERRAQRKKQNRRKQRPKRSQDEASMINIDHKLQNLMLEIESDYARSNAFGTGNLESDIDSMNPRPLRSEYNASMIEIDTKFYDLTVGIESDSNAGSRILNALEIRNSVSDVDSIYSRPLRLESNASMIETDLELHDLTVEIESDCNCRSKNSICSVPNASEIDLKLHNLTDEIKSDCNSRSKISLSNKSEMRNSVSDINSTNPRLVRSESNTSATDLDLKFQDLTLEIESDCNSQWNIQNASEIRTSFSDADSENLELNCAQKLAMCSSSDERNGVEDEVINLLSPTPQIHQRCASRCGGNSEMVEVIDLGESDVDASPEHERKVRELRLFLASIRDEIS